MTALLNLRPDATAIVWVLLTTGTIAFILYAAWRLYQTWTSPTVDDLAIQDEEQGDGLDYLRRRNGEGR